MRYPVSVAERQIPWCIRWWDDAWVARDERGTDVVEAPDVVEARAAVEQRLLMRFGRPMRLVFAHPATSQLSFTEGKATVVAGAPFAGATLYLAEYPASLPDRHQLRARLCGGASPHQLRTELLAAGATLRAVSVAFCEAFGLEPEAVTGAEVLARRSVWTAPHQLREAHARGASLVDTLHEQYEAEGRSFSSFRALRDAFDLEFGDTKMLIGLACDRDPSFDASFAEALRRAEARR